MVVSHWCLDMIAPTKCFWSSLDGVAGSAFAAIVMILQVFGADVLV